MKNAPREVTGISFRSTFHLHQAVVHPIGI